MSGLAYRMLEEHHEAFYLWGAAVEEGILRPSGNVLFHVDHHDDLECGGYFHDFTRPFASLEERRQFTYEKLGIADFIVPALYEGLFDTLYNMKSLLTKPFVSRQKIVRREGKNCLLLDDYIPFLHRQRLEAPDSTDRLLTFWEGGLSETPPLQSVVLDIDLDYFCWDDSLQTAGPKRIELTREAYEAFCTDPYHPLRILPRRLFDAVECGGRYYLQYAEPPCAVPPRDEARIQKRVQRFFGWLQAQPWTPSLVTVCRSARSGYLPRDKARWVEQLVTEGLDRMEKP